MSHEWEGPRRRETGLIEFICQHGVGHPSKGSALWMAEAQENRDSDPGYRFHCWTTHGCDGCCKRPDFPGNWYGSMRAAHRIIRDLKKRIAELEAERG